MAFEVGQKVMHTMRNWYNKKGETLIREYKFEAEIITKNDRKLEIKFTNGTKKHVYPESLEAIP